jgi:hypothetical protein
MFNSLPGEKGGPPLAGIAGVSSFLVTYYQGLTMPAANKTKVDGEHGQETGQANEKLVH